MAAQKLPERLVERLALDVPQRGVDGRQRQGEDAARPAAGIAGAQLGDDRLDALRVLADGRGGEILDGGMQAARQAAAIERDADAFDAGIGAQAHRHDRPLAAGFLRHVGQGIVLGDEQDAGLIARDLHARLPRRFVFGREFPQFPQFPLPPPVMVRDAGFAWFGRHSGLAR